MHRHTAITLAALALSAALPAHATEPAPASSPSPATHDPSNPPIDCPLHE